MWLIEKYKKINDTEKGRKLLEFVRFCIVGGIATVIHYGVYLLIISLIDCCGELWTNIAYSIGYVLSWCCNLWLTAHFTFKEDINTKRGIGFALSHLVNYCLHIILLNFFIWIGLPKQFAPIPVYCIVVPVNYLLVRLVFKHR